MFGHIASRFAIWTLKNARLSTEDRAFLTTHLLTNLAALPWHDIITKDEEEKLLIKGRYLGREEMLSLRESAEALSKNQVRRIIREQTAMEAIKIGVHTAVSNEMNLFCKSALWNHAKEQELLNNLISMLGASTEE